MAAEAEGAGEKADSADAEQLGPQTLAEAPGMVKRYQPPEARWSRRDDGGNQW